MFDNTILNQNQYFLDPNQIGSAGLTNTSELVYSSLQTNDSSGKKIITPKMIDLGQNYIEWGDPMDERPITFAIKEYSNDDG